MASIRKRTTSRGQTRYDVRFRGPGGLEQTKSFNRVADARAFAHQVEVERQTRSLVSPAAGRITFGEYAWQWAEEHPTTRVRTKQEHESILRVWLVPAFGSVKLIDMVDEVFINQWIAAQQRVGAPRSRLAKVVSVLRAVLNDAAAKRRIPRSPFDRRGAIHLPREPRREEPSRDLDAILARDLVAAMHPYYRPLVKFATVTALRWGQIVAIETGGVDLPAGTVFARDSIAEGVGGRIRQPEVKTQATRTRVMVPDSIVPDLAAQLARPQVRRSGLLFPAMTGEVLSRSAFRRGHWLKAVVAAGMEPGEFHFHDLRKIAASVAVGAGVDVKTVQEFLGHASADTTLTFYARATSHQLRAVASLMDPVFAEAS